MKSTSKNTSGLSKVMKVLGVILLVLILVLAGLSINQGIAVSKLRENFPAPGQLVEVEGHLIHIYCIGRGSPTVVIDAGNGSFSLEWMPIQETLSSEGRVCTFDRSGYGWSEPGPEPRDGLQVVSELHALLQAAGETGPYVLVGHSLGGVHMRMYAALYPEDVSGMVLVDTVYPLGISTEYETQRQTSIGFYQVMNLLVNSGIMRILGPLGGESSMPEQARKLPPELQDPYLNLLLDSNQYVTAMAELNVISQTFDQANAMLLSGPQPFGTLPLIVLTAGQTAAPGSTPFITQPVPVSEKQIDLQFGLSGQSSQGEQRVIRESGHLMHVDAPEAVIEAVRDILVMSAKQP